MAVVGWADAWEFALGTEERPAYGRRKKAVHGPRAFRVPSGGREQRVFAPCAFLPEKDRAKGQDLRIYEDPGLTSLLCTVGAAESAEGMRSFPVRDAAGAEVGRVRTAAALRKALNPAWFLDQPGHPEVAGRHDWAEGSAGDVAWRGASKAASAFLSRVAIFGEEEGDHVAPRGPREWRADGELVMASAENRRFLLHAAWLDRRLVFAYALLRSRR
ncbi:hypothetical protein [Streptomyces sp. SCSIO ZS0520]|uniref:hypothetical protein n=1 Tax=Streptomyces sp. SCSIO ZS0520 TaxID=2892996 RepID=UPI0021D96403|nr:hypothetical protein [Streptomyces sp. SCSIO ZS0520]